jgi:phospholipid-translocating ATPase
MSVRVLSHLYDDCEEKAHSNLGVGNRGKQGKQGSLAAEFTVTQFSFLTKLLLWHGRNAYHRSAKLAQFVIHRGLIISIMQAFFSCYFIFYSYCVVSRGG